MFLYLSKLKETQTSFAELLYDILCTQGLKKVLPISPGQVNCIAVQVTFKAYLLLLVC